MHYFIESPQYDYEVTSFLILIFIVEKKKDLVKRK